MSLRVALFLSADFGKIQGYATVLALISVISKSWSTPAIAANLLTFLSALGVYAYRDLWPLAKYNGRPADAAEGSVLWIKIALLAFTPVFVPLFVPRKYIPLDPKACLTILYHDARFLLELTLAPTEPHYTPQSRTDLFDILDDDLYVLGSSDCHGI